MPRNIRINNRTTSTLLVGDVIAERAYYGSSEVFVAPEDDFDPEAATYIAAVEAADEQTLEEGVKQAIDGFVTGCKADGIWGALKASCILAGARTLNGALVPLAGDAPTNFNFVSADYDRVMGLKGDGSTKYLDSNRANNADPQDSNHNAVYVTTLITEGMGGNYIGAGSTDDGCNNLGRGGGSENGVFVRNRDIDTLIRKNTDQVVGFFGASRSNPENYIRREGGLSETRSRTSRTPTTDNLFVQARNNGSGVPESPSDGRLSFYSIGESVDLATLDARVTTLMTEIEAALT